VPGNDPTSARRRARDVCLVIGGAGFLGSHLVEALLARGRAVRILDNLTTGSRGNLSRCLDQVDLIVGDLRNPDLVREAMDGVDVVFYHAPLSADESVEHPHHSRCGIVHVLIASRETSVRRVVYASSARVYGPETASPHAETDPVLPSSPYALDKLYEEQLCTEFSLLYGLETVRLRYSQVFGPRQSLESPYARLVTDSLEAIRQGRQLVPEGNGHEPQDLLFVDDAVAATLLAAETPHRSGRVYNIARGRTSNALEVVQTLNQLLRSHLELLPSRRPIPQEFQGPIDITRARDELGFQPAVSLQDGLTRCLGLPLSGPHHQAMWATQRPKT
jgi:UDP-glucose 4-epimerase